jgi:hypothetical protein
MCATLSCRATLTTSLPMRKAQKSSCGGSGLRAKATSVSRGGPARRTLPRRSGGRPRLSARRQAPRARAMATATPLDTMAGAMILATEAMAECLRPSCPCHTCVVYGLSPGRRPEPHPRPGHVLQEWMARALREDGKTRRPSLALGCIDRRSCTDRRHVHTGLMRMLRSRLASDGMATDENGNRRDGNRSRYGEFWYNAEF